MLTKILTAVILLSFFGCGRKEYRKDSNNAVETVQQLNKGKPEEVIREFSNRKDLSSRERYYLASAQSQAGGVDVLSLYSILEIQLFHKKALEWNDLSKEKNPYLKFMKAQENVDHEKRQKKREARWKKYEKRILANLEYETEKPSFKILEERTKDQKGWGYELTEEKYTAADEDFDRISKKINESCYASVEDVWEAFYKAIDEEMNFSDYNTYFIGRDQLFNYYIGTTIVENYKKKYLEPEKCIGGDFSAVRWEMIYMNLLWNTYEAIPMIKKMPSLTEEQQNYVTDSLENYFILIDTPDFKETSLKNLGVLTGVSLLSYYKGSFDLEEVNDMTDLFCSFDPVHIIDNYSMIRKRLLFLLRVHEKAKSDFKLGTLKKQIEQANEFLPEELSPEKKQEYIDRVDEFKVDFCFMR